jgi:hypothetical protein
MASLILGAVGSAVGSSYSGFTVLGVSMSGAQIGGMVGTIAGSAIDASLQPSVKRYGSRLSDITLQTAREGAPIPRLYGRMRLSGQLIWASRFQEATKTSGGKGGSASSTSYAYSVSFAVGLCEGVITRLGRIWADGNLLDPSFYTMRLYRGDDRQLPDPLIEEIEGVVNTPAYRGLCYVVFEDMPLTAFGNRIPQLQFEIVRAIAISNPASLENRLAAVALIPGAGEFVYAPEAVTDDDGAGTTIALNSHNTSGVSDVTASLDELQALAPNLKSVSLVVGWFGDDLRCGVCKIRPGVEQQTRQTYPESWSVAGIARVGAYLISMRDGRPAYGGTPSDASVKAAIAALKARGLAVTFYPFVFMDIAAGNSLFNPYTATAGQPAYPWRGRITVSPAPGASGTVDQTAAAATQIAAFFTAYRPMVLHYAQLCAEAGGVESFLIGSELVGLTRARSDAATYPAVAALKQLAADVRSLLPNAKLGYAADWSEYSAHALGGGALRFNLDPLWSDAAIDFIGIDNYLPLADWRDAGSNLDGVAYASPYDPACLASAIRGGEDYDWYYASPAARAAQNRTAITDGLGKPWVWRAKDIWNWWANRHYDRPNGTESPTATAWVPQSKPIRFTELGCPAVDKGANQPNVFYDPKSSESVFPYYSSGQRDDLIQRRFLEAHLNFWRDPANNPTSAVYGAPMLDVDHLAVWCWDARPYPFFPTRDDVWGDTGNYATGHWLNGRLGDSPLADLVTRICADSGFTAIDTSGLTGLITGYAITDTMSLREALAPLMAGCFFDAVETGGLIRFVPRGSMPALALSETDLVVSGEDFGFILKRAEAGDVPAASRLSYIDAASYDEAVAQTRRLAASTRVASSSLPMVLEQSEAAAINERLLADAAVMAESAAFALPPSRLALDPTDEVLLTAGGRSRRLRLTAIADAGGRRCEAVATDPSVYAPFVGASRSVSVSQSLPQPGRPLVVLLDLPLLSEEQNPSSPFAAAFADPWPGRVVIYKDGTRAAELSAPATIGQTLYDFWSGPLNRFDRINTLYLKLYHGTLLSVSDTALFAGANRLAVQNPSGAWEVLQFGQADLIAINTWRLSRLLRGRQGTEQAMASPVPAGARVVLLDDALVPIPLSQAEALLPHSYTYGPQGKALADPAFQTVTTSFTAAGLMPPAPCHIRHRWSANGDLTLTWYRRDRSPVANSILLAETPHSDPSLFDLEILQNGAVIRTFSNLPQNSQLYTAAQQSADFPSGLPNPLVIRVCQRSSVLGRGRQKTESLYVR